jgi:molybdopterin synthase sulfur carrier subunit
MKVKVKTFGISRDILGGREVTIEVAGSSVADLRMTLSTQFPALDKLNSLFIAVNQNYARDEVTLSETDEIALIPPVSGG